MKYVPFARCIFTLKILPFFVVVLCMAIPQAEAQTISIDDCTELDAIGTTGFPMTGSYLLSTSLNCTANGNAIMIGTGSSAFRGSFNGGTNTVTISLDSSQNEVGLFRLLSGATISNLTIAGTVVSRGNHVGALAGLANSGLTLTNITSTATVRGRNLVGGLIGFFGAKPGNGFTLPPAVGRYTFSGLDAQGIVTGSGSDYGAVGGLFGQMYLRTTAVLSMSDGTASATVRGSGSYVGGLIGIIDVTGGANPNLRITDSSATGPIVGRHYVGGFIGYFDNLTISGSYATGSVDASALYVGGFVGGAESGVIDESYSTGTVTSARWDVGGFGGYVGGVEIVDSYATGDVTGDEWVGGFVGETDSNAEYTRCYATGDVRAIGAISEFEGGVVGGLIAEGETVTITDSYALGDVTAEGAFDYYVGGILGTAQDVTLANAYYALGAITGEDDIGGIVGYDYGGNTITNSFWDTETSGTTHGCQDASCVGATGKTTSAMKTLSTFTDAGWNFDTTWGIHYADNSGYPFLRFQGLTHQPTSSSSSSFSSSSSSSSSEDISRGGGRRGSPGRGGQAQPLSVIRHNRLPTSSSAPLNVLPPQSHDITLKVRVCDRVVRWFAGNEKMMTRINERLNKRFGFVCSG